MSEPLTFAAGSLYTRWTSGPAPSGIPEIPAASVTELCCDITAPADPTGTLPHAAILALGAGDPGSGDWQAGTWEPGSAWAAGAPVTAMVLIGPATALPLAAGTYRAWFKASAGAESPVLDAGLLVIT